MHPFVYTHKEEKHGIFMCVFFSCACKYINLRKANPIHFYNSFFLRISTIDYLFICLYNLYQLMVSKNQ